MLCTFRRAVREAESGGRKVGGKHLHIKQTKSAKRFDALELLNLVLSEEETVQTAQSREVFDLADSIGTELEQFQTLQIIDAFNALELIVDEIELPAVESGNSSRIRDRLLEFNKSIEVFNASNLVERKIEK